MSTVSRTTRERREGDRGWVEEDEILPGQSPGCHERVGGWDSGALSFHRRPRLMAGGLRPDVRGPTPEGGTPRKLEAQTLTQ